MIMKYRMWVPLYQILIVFIMFTLLDACAHEDQGKANPFLVVFTPEDLFATSATTPLMAFSVVNTAPSCTTVAGDMKFPVFQDLSSMCYIFFTDVTTNSIVPEVLSFPTIEPVFPSFYCDQSITSSSTYYTASTSCIVNHIYQLSVTCTHLKNGSYTAVSSNISCTP